MAQHVLIKMYCFWDRENVVLIYIEYLFNIVQNYIKI